MNTKMDGIKIKIGLIICQTKMKYENSKNSYKVENSTKSYKIVRKRLFPCLSGAFLSKITGYFR